MLYGRGGREGLKVCSVGVAASCHTAHSFSIAIAILTWDSTADSDSREPAGD